MVVASVAKKSPAEEVGLRAGDLIEAVDDDDIECGLDFQRALLERTAGEEIRLSVRRNGEPIIMRLTLARTGAAAKSSSEPAWDLFGLQLKPIPSNEFRQRHQTRYRGGLVVTSVRTGGPAAKRGIRPGDVLVGMHKWETITIENVNYILNRPDFKSLHPLKFFVLRGNETLYGYLPVAAKTVHRQ